MIAAQFAIALDLTDGMVSRLLSGERRPTLDLMVKIRELTGWSVENQADAWICGSYPWKLRMYMEQTNVSDGERVQTLRSVPGSSPELRTLETGDSI